MNRSSFSRRLLASLAALLFASGALALARTQTVHPQLISRAGGVHGRPAAIASFRSLSGHGDRVLFTSSAPLGAKAGGLFMRSISFHRTTRLAPGGDAVIAAAAPTIVYSDEGLFVLRLGAGGRHRVAPERSEQPSLSASGRVLAFTSGAGSLTDRAERQVFVRRLPVGKLIQVSRASGARGALADGESFEPAISANGRYVVFRSHARNLAPTRTGSTEPTSVFLRDLRTDRTTRIAPPGMVASEPAISADGSVIAFTGRDSVLVLDRRTGTLTSPDPGGRYSGRSNPSLSADGRYLACRARTQSPASEDLAVTDLRTGRTARIASVGRLDAGSAPLQISADGRFIGFDTYALGFDGPGKNAVESGLAYRIRNPLFRARVRGRR